MKSFKWLGQFAVLGFIVAALFTIAGYLFGLIPTAEDLNAEAAFREEHARSIQRAGDKARAVEQMLHGRTAMSYCDNGNDVQLLMDLKGAENLLSMGDEVTWTDHADRVHKRTFPAISPKALGFSHDALAVLRAKARLLGEGMRLEKGLNSLSPANCLNDEADEHIEETVTRIQEEGTSLGQLLLCRREAVQCCPAGNNYVVTSFKKDEMDIWLELGAWHATCANSLYIDLQIYPEDGKGRESPEVILAALKRHHAKARQAGMHDVAFPIDEAEQATQRAFLRYGYYLVRSLRKGRQDLTILFPKTVEVANELSDLQKVSGLMFRDFGTTRAEITQLIGRTPINGGDIFAHLR